MQMYCCLESILFISVLSWQLYLLFGVLLELIHRNIIHTKNIMKNVCVVMMMINMLK